MTRDEALTLILLEYPDLTMAEAERLLESPHSQPLLGRPDRVLGAQRSGGVRTDPRHPVPDHLQRLPIQRNQERIPRLHILERIPIVL